MMKTFLVPAALGVLLASSPLHAAERQAFETVKTWEVERNVGNAGKNPCIMSRSYQDKNDGNAVNGIVFARDGAEVVLVLVYQNWEWDANDKVKASLLVDRKLINSKLTWIGDAQTLTSKMSSSVTSNLLSAKSIILRFDNGDADFQIPGFADGYEALLRCDASAVQAAVPAPVAPAAVTPAAPVALPTTASSSGYRITTIGSGADFAGCLAQDEAVGVGVLAVGSTVTLFAHSPRFPVVKGASVKGSWSVDGRTPVSFASTASGPNVIDFEVPNTRDAVATLTTGKTIDVIANGVQTPFALGNMTQAFTALGTCMESKKAP